MSDKQRLMLILMPVMLLSACMSDQQADLEQWTAEQRKNTRSNVKPLVAPKDFIPVNYKPDGQIDPFDSQKLTKALLPKNNAESNALIAAEERRRKEPLESYPLDTMAMVGVLKGSKGLLALVKVDGLIYQVATGNYLGQNYGLVRSVTDQNITLREIVQDAAGEWIERSTTLDLQEK